MSVKLLSNFFKKSLQNDRVFSPKSLPYACNYDSRSILTKNGGILQCILIDCDKNDKEKELRICIRDFISENIFDLKEKIGIWFDLTRIENDSCGLKNFLSVSFVSISEFTSNDFFTSMVINKHESYLQKISDNISSFIDKFLSYLNDNGFSARVIQDYPEKEDVSNIATFLCKKLMFDTSLVKNFECTDMSDSLYDNLLCRNVNDIIELNLSGNKRFVKSLSIKTTDYYPIKSLERLLSSDMEFVISEIVDFSGKGDYKKLTYEKDNYFSFAKSYDGVKETFQDFNCNHSTNVFVFASSKDEMKDRMIRFVEILNQSGFIIAMHDIFMDCVFWSRMPGNFRFIRKSRPTRLDRIAGFMLCL